MRGFTIAATLVLAVSLFGTAAAVHETTADASVDAGEERLATAAQTFEQLALPQPMQQASQTGMATQLPGPGEELTVEFSLDTASATMLDADRYGVEATLDTLATDTADAGDDATLRESTDADTSLESGTLDASADDGETTAPMTEPSGSSDDGDADAAGTSTEASTASSVKDAWEERSTAEKAAIGAGLLGALVLGPLTLYSRIQRDDALENDTRRTIYEIVETNPGICIQDVADGADVSYSTASYHLDKLVRMDYLSRRKEGNKVLYYKNGGTFSQQEQELVPLLKNDEAMRVFRHILENPWCYRAEVAEALDVSHTTVNWHLDNLQEADLVEEHREGRSCHLRIPEEALERVSGVVEKLDELGVEDDYAHVAAPVAA